MLKGSKPALSAEQVERIRELYTDPANTASAWKLAGKLKARYHVSQGTLYNAIKGLGSYAKISDGPPPGTDLIPCETPTPEPVMSLAEIADEAEKYGFYKTTDPATRRTRWGITCSECKTVSTRGWPPTTSPSLMIKNMRNAGWMVAKNGPPVCADCARRHRTRQEVTQVENVVSITGGGGPNMNLPVQLVPEPDFRLTRAVMRLLETVFDENVRRYRDGYSDERVAQECNTTVENVAHVRVGAFGELAEPPEYELLRADFETMRNDIAILETSLLDEVSKMIEPLKKRLQAMQERLDRETRRQS